MGCELCDLIKYNTNPDKKPTAWSHITCNGSVANLESMWAGKNSFCLYRLVLTFSSPQPQVLPTQSGLGHGARAAGFPLQLVQGPHLPEQGETLVALYHMGTPQHLPVRCAQHPRLSLLRLLHLAHIPPNCTHALHYPEDQQGQ
jgi:hypothetical protein